MRPNKKQRKRIKAVRLRNKKLLKKYPWLRDIDCWGRPIDSYDSTLLDQMEDGWRKCFGMLMVKDLDKALKGHMLYTQQIKEKWGMLHWYFSVHPDVDKEVDDIIEAYSHISRHVCIHCGQPDVGYTKDGWIMPICKTCFCHDDYYTEEDYYEQISPHNRMPLEYSYRKDGKKITVDISEYTNKVRVNWYKRHKLNKGEGR